MNVQNSPRRAWKAASRALAHQVLAGGGAGALMVVLDAVVGLGPRPFELRVVLATAALWIEIGALWGIVQYGALGFASRWRCWQGGRGEASAPDPVSRVLWLASVLVSAPILGAVLFVVLPRLGGIHNEQLVSALAAVAIAAALTGLRALGAVVLPYARRLLRRWADEGRLPTPGWGTYLGCVAVAMLGLELGLRARFQDELSGAESGLLGITLVSVAMWFGSLGWRPRDGEPRAGRVVSWAGGVVALLAALVALLPLGAMVEAYQGMRIGRRGLSWLRELTDVDRDGYSSLLGHGDCAPLDGQVFPAAREIPGNGKDEDCDGHDAGAERSAEERVVPIYASRAPTPADGAPLNVIWIVVDAMRADSMSVYGYDKPTTPYLRELAKESWVFTQAWSQASTTMLSIPSMLSGRLPGEMTWVRRDGRLSPADSEVMFAERLKELGYRTGLIVHSYFFNHFKGMFQGYDRVENVWLDGKMKPWFERSSPIATTLAIRFIERGLEGAIDGKSPFFLTVYYEDPHHTYATHREAYPRFTGPSKVVKGIPRKYQKAKARYDGEIAFADRHIGFLLEYLRATPELWARTVVVVVADHGEEFGEHGGTKHARTCYQESTHVPLMIRVPGLAPRRLHAPVALIDVAPTLAQLLGIEPDPARMSGASLWQATEGGGASFAGRPVFCTTIGGNPRVPDLAVRSVRHRGRLLVHDYVNDRDELYLTDEDPLEQHDRAGESELGQVVQELRAWLRATLRGNVIRDRLTR